MSRYLAIALVLLAAGSAQAAEKRLDRTFTVAPGGALTVDADGASVHVSGSDSNQVVVHVLARGSEDNLANTQIEAVQKDNGVAVTLKKVKRGWSWRGNGNSDEEIEVTVPRRYAIEVSTGGGSVELRDTVGTATLRTSGGDVSAKNVTGNVEARTSGRLDPGGYDQGRRRCEYFGRRRPPPANRRSDPRENQWRQRALQPRRREPWNLGDDVRWRHRVEPAKRHDRQH